MYPNSSYKNKKRIKIIVLVVGILVVSVAVILLVFGKSDMVRKYSPISIHKSDSSDADSTGPANSQKNNVYKNIPKGATDESDPDEQTNDSQVLLDE